MLQYTRWFLSPCLLLHVSLIVYRTSVFLMSLSQLLTGNMFECFLPLICLCFPFVEYSNLTTVCLIPQNHEIIWVKSEQSQIFAHKILANLHQNDRISGIFFVCHEICQNWENVYFFIWVSHFCDLKSFLKQTSLDIMPAYWIFCDIKVIFKKAKIRTSRKLWDIRYPNMKW